MNTSSAVLDEHYHKRLMLDADMVCETANIPRSMLERSAKEYCGHEVINWLTNYPRKVEAGRSLMLVGEQKHGPETQMMAIASALIRNFIDARVVPLNSLLQMIENGTAFDPTVLLVPNLYVKGGGKTLPAWKMQQVYDFLLQRRVSGKLSVVYVQDIMALKSDFGLVFSQHLEDNYEVVAGE